MSSESTTLRVYEEVLLMALRDEEGTMSWRASTCNYALAGALVAELSIEERIRIDRGKKQTVTVVSAAGCDDPLLDEALGAIRASRKQRSASDWVGRLARLKKLRARVATALAQKGVLRVDEGTVLLIFKRRIYPTVDAGPERRIKERLRRAITGATATPEPRTTVLLALAKASGMLRIYFDRHLLKDNRQRIEKIVRAQPVGAATARAIAAAQAAAGATTAVVVASR